MPDYTNILTTTRVNILAYLFLRHDNTRAFSTASDLKAFIENPMTYYGYSLTIEKTIDTVVVVKDIVTEAANWRPALSSIYSKLLIFINSNHLKVMQPKIVSFKPISKDSLEIRAGIPVNKVAGETSDIKFLKMPKGDMLVGEYVGPYNKRNSLSSAMEKYMSNHSLNEVAVPYEKFLNNEIPATDTSEVSIKMYYPILN
ncbi:MAG TPA: hypothetical protein VFT78_13630 [Hanamia sp.]|nr:hypothetical protein [Hanamia sp.]